MSVLSESTAASPASLFADYSATADAFDEMLAARQTPHAHWKDMVHSLERLGAEELRRRVEKARRIVHEHGITYNVYADAQGLDRPWEIDLVPLIIPPDE